MKAVRANVIIDSGKVINQLGAELIETPDQYKRLNNMGKIISIGPECSYLTSQDIGKTCVVGVDRYAENRINPLTSQAIGLSPTWHYNVHESKIVCLLE
jgi:hypothetical protein